MATISFNIKPVTNGQLQIRAVLRNGQQREYKYTGYNIPDKKVKSEYKYWDAKAQRVKGDHEDRHIINAKLSDWDSRFQKYVKVCKESGVAIDLDAFRASLDHGSADVIAAPGKLGLVAIVEAFLKANKRRYSARNVAAYEVLQHQLADYQEKRGKTVLATAVNEAFYNDYVAYLIDEHHNTNNSIKRKLTRIVTVMNYAKRNTLVATDDYTNTPFLKGTPSKKVSLLPDELEALHGLEIEDPVERNILDAFLVACETGLRHSDIVQLAPIHFVTTRHAGVQLSILDLTQFKGSKMNTVPLSDRAIALLNKHKPKKTTEPYFDLKYSQFEARVLKRIFEDAKLNRPCEVMAAKGSVVKRETKALHKIISFHIARNTYITGLLAKGAPVVFVKDNVGHADIRTTMGYSKQDDFTRYIKTLELLNKK